MNPSLLTRRPWKAFAAAASLLAVALGASAADVSHVDVVGGMSLHRACPQADDEALGDELSTAWDDARKPSAVAVSFKVRRHHVFDVAPQTESPRTYHQIRRAVQGLDCDGGDDEAHAVRLVVRFVDADRGGPRVAASEDSPGR